jgi:GTP-binding protein SAR1
MVLFFKECSLTLDGRGCAIIGLDNAGKSTLLHKLCNNEMRAFVPTTKAHAKTFSLGSITFTAWDLGGHEQVF